MILCMERVLVTGRRFQRNRSPHRSNNRPVDSTQIQLGSTNNVLLVCRAYSNWNLPEERPDAQLHVFNGSAPQTAGSPRPHPRLPAWCDLVNCQLGSSTSMFSSYGDHQSVPSRIATGLNHHDGSIHFTPRLTADRYGSFRTSDSEHVVRARPHRRIITGRWGLPVPLWSCQDPTRR